MVATMRSDLKIRNYFDPMFKKLNDDSKMYCIKLNSTSLPIK